MHQARIDFIKNLAIEAGKLTLEGYGKSDQIPKNVQDGYDIATEYDLRAEELVKRRILDEFGEPVLGEEAGLIGDRELAKQRLWIVDPIDGTFNYQRGVPLYGVTIAYCEGGIPTSGAIYLPVLEQLFYAGKGRGAVLARATCVHRCRSRSATSGRSPASSSAWLVGACTSCSLAATRRAFPGAPYAC